MTRALKYLSALCAMFCVQIPASAQTTLPDARLNALVLRGIDLTWEQRYNEADSMFRETIREFPNHPAGYVFRAGVIQSKAIDYETQVDVPSFDSLISVGKEKAKALIEKGDNAKWGHFFLGTAEGYDSYARVYRGDWVGGLLRGLASVSSLKDALKLDSAMYDAYGGVGTFYYWRSRKTQHFNWLPFVGDDRPEAYLYLEKTVSHGLYNRHTALSALITIYTDAGSYEKALAYARIGLQRYPGNRTFLWEQATAVEKLGKPFETAEAYKALLKAILGGGEKNRYNEIVCRLNLAKAEMELGDSALVRDNLRAIMRYHEDDFESHLRHRAQDKLEQAALLMRRLSNGRPAGG
jgi:tetratricopeptide (TPR) repeat protein